MSPKRMVQVEMVHDAKRGGFVVTFSPVRSRWVKYGGFVGNKRCSFCNEFFETGDFYYQSKENGALCEGHARFLMGVERDGKPGV